MNIILKGRQTTFRRNIFNMQKSPLDKEGLFIKIAKNKSSYMMIAPYMTLFFIFTVLPVISSIVLSFTNFNMLQFPNWIGWSNYTRLFFSDDIFLIAVKNTLIFALLTGPISYILCLFFAWLINELNPKLRAFMTLIFYAPSISGNVYFIWSFLFSGDEYGFVNGTLMKFGILREPIQWMTNPAYNLKIIIVIQLWLSLGASFLAFIAGLQSVDKALFESGAIDGIKNRWQELWYITLPSIAPQLMFGAVMQIASSFSVAQISMELAGFPSTNYSAHTVVTHIIDYGTIRYEMGYASSIAVILFAAMILTKQFIGAIMKRVGDD